MKDFILDNLEEILILLGFLFFVVGCFMISTLVGMFSTSLSLIIIGVLVIIYKNKMANSDS